MGGLPKINFVFILAQVMGVVSTATITQDQRHGRVDAAVIEAIGGSGEVHLLVTLAVSTGYVIRASQFLPLALQVSYVHHTAMGRYVSSGRIC